MENIMEGKKKLLFLHKFSKYQILLIVLPCYV